MAAMGHVKDLIRRLSALTLPLSLLIVFAGSVQTSSAADPQMIKRRVNQVEYHVREFEKEVAQQRGGEKMVWRSRQAALERVQQLKLEFPDDPDVEKLYQRVRIALMKSMGEYTEVSEDWTLYKRNEDNLRKVIAEAGKKQWEELLAKHKDKLLAKTFPAPDSDKVSIEDIKGSYVLLDDVQYPHHQFYGATGEYVFSGKPSSGYYFVNIGVRDWVGPYEAVKRFRRNVDSSLAEVKNWTVLGEIVNITAEVPQAGEDKIGNFQYGWVIKPVALYVPDHVMAVYDAEKESSGTYIGEERVAQIKDSWYTVKEIPDDVTPERLMEIFMTAIKEKNYALYEKCIDPERRETDIAEDRLRYHWDLHQERFHGQYIHASFDKAKISVVKGFDEGNDLMNFFLDDKQKATLTKIGGTKIEEAIVESRAYDDNGKQLGSPHPHKLVRRGGGRWYVEDYAARF
ncbi:MAG: hypothetical protein J6I40_03830 [Mailhella sp.]|nr:hypothetical protein [Mailhella sp.]